MGKILDVNLYDVNRKMLYDKFIEIGYDCVKLDGVFYLFVKVLEEDVVSFCENVKKFNFFIVLLDDFGCLGYVRILYCVDLEMIKRFFDVF